MVRNATAVWKGTGKEGKGTMSTASGVLQDSQYSYSTRFEQGIGTNPEELVAAAHAGCFSMKLSFILVESGFTPDSLETKCEVTFENGSITKSDLTVTGKVPGIDENKWQDCVKKAEETCPITKSLTAKTTAKGKLS